MPDLSGEVGRRQSYQQDCKTPDLISRLCGVRGASCSAKVRASWEHGLDHIIVGVIKFLFSEPGAVTGRAVVLPRAGAAVGGARAVSRANQVVDA